MASPEAGVHHPVFEADHVAPLSIDLIKSDVVPLSRMAKNVVPDPSLLFIVQVSLVNNLVQVLPPFVLLITPLLVARMTIEGLVEEIAISYTVSPDSE